MIDERTFAEINEVAAAVSEWFAASGKTLSVAESFTGGAVAESLVSVPGASGFLREGLVCYSAAAKEARLGVEKSTIERYGAVSEQTVREMIRGLLASPLRPDYAVATTGNAGPGAEAMSESGVCYAAVGSKSGVTVKRFVLTGERRQNMAAGALIALETLAETVNKQ